VLRQSPKTIRDDWFDEECRFWKSNNRALNHETNRLFSRKRKEFKKIRVEEIQIASEMKYPRVMYRTINQPEVISKTEHYLHQRQQREPAGRNRSEMTKQKYIMKPNKLSSEENISKLLKWKWISSLSIQ
jgi:hypothetical protein